MSLTIRAALVLLALGSLSTTPARAEQSSPAPPAADAAGSASAACVHAYEQAQEQRHSGRLLEARGQLASCARDICPEFIRTDCGNWYSDLQAEMPTVVFAARSAGRDLTDVRVSIGPRVLAARIDGEAIELNPGEYDFEFSAPGMQPLTQHVLISRGERNRLQRAELVPSSAEAAPRTAAASLPPPKSQSLLLPGVFGGVAVLGLSSFAAFAAWGHSSESSLERSCSPHCSEDQISGVRSKYLVADVSLAAAVASLGLATYFALSANSERHTARATRALPFDVQATTRGLSATYQEAF